jgi:hypothetical protein
MDGELKMALLAEARAALRDLEACPECNGTLAVVERDGRPAVGCQECGETWFETKPAEMPAPRLVKGGGDGG